MFLSCCEKCLRETELHATLVQTTLCSTRDVILHVDNATIVFVTVQKCFL